MFRVSVVRSCNVKIFRVITVQAHRVSNTTTAFVLKNVAIKVNLPLYRILNEQIDM